MTAAIPIFDGHNDTLLTLTDGPPGEGRAGRDFFERGTEGALDLPRAVEGGFGGGFFAVFVRPDPAEQECCDDGLMITETGYEVRLPPALDPAYALRSAMDVTARLFRLEASSDGRLRVVRNAAELEECLRDGVLAAVLHFEGAEAIDTELRSLEVFYQAGLRSLGLVWSRPNAFAHGVPFRYPSSPDTGPGLTDAGRELVRECNRLGILLDLSHLNERGFWDVAALSTAPLVATHSAAHAICPSARNLTDRQLDAIRDSEGMVGVNFEVSFIRPDGRKEPDTPLGMLADQIEYLIGRLGPERVGFGSDFDGATMPRELGDAAGLPRLLDALRSRGCDEPAIRRLAHENWLRLLRRTWRP